MASEEYWPFPNPSKLSMSKSDIRDRNEGKKNKFGPCKGRTEIGVEESGVYRGPLETKNLRSYPEFPAAPRTQTDPIAPQRVPSCEMPFSDEDEDGPNSFTYYTVPAAVVDVAEAKSRNFGVDQLMPDLKKLAVKGELSDREKQVFRYFRRRMVMELLQFMMNHLLAVEPDDPLDFLRGLLDECLLFRSGHMKEPPLLFGPAHLEALYNSFDPFSKGYITIHQYHTAMKTVMAKNYNKSPDRNDNNDVSKSVFLTNAKMALVENLLDLIILTPSVTEKPPKVVAMDTTASDQQKKHSVKDEIKQYMKSLVRGMREAEEAQDSPEEVIELEGIKKPKLKVPSEQEEKFGDYARPLKNLQDAFKANPDIHF